MMRDDTVVAHILERLYCTCTCACTGGLSVCGKPRNNWTHGDLAVIAIDGVTMVWDWDRGMHALGHVQQKHSWCL